jgi:hypothetical protein
MLVGGWVRNPDMNPLAGPSRRGLLIPPASGYDLAESLGARVVHYEARGYGAAHAKGETFRRQHVTRARHRLF